MSEREESSGDARAVLGAAEPDAAGYDSAVSDDTVVVGGARGAGDDTVVVDRSVIPSDDTVVLGKAPAIVESAGGVDDATVAVDRGPAAGGPGSGFGAAEDATVAVPRPGAQNISDDVLRVLPSRRSVRGLRSAPVEPDFGRQAVDAPGAGAVDTYMPRAAVPSPLLSQQSSAALAGSAAPSQAGAREGAVLPSVERKSARLGLVGVVSCVLACGVSVVGVSMIVSALLR